MINAIPFNRSILNIFWMVIAFGLGVLLVMQSPNQIILLAGAVVVTVLLTQSPLIALLFLLTLSPLRTLILTEAPGVLPLEIGQIMVGIIIVAWGINRVINGKPILVKVWTPILIPVLVFFVSVSLTVFTADSLSAWLNEWLKWAIIIVLILLILNMQQWEWVAFALVISAFAHALVGLYTFLGGSGALHLLINDRFFRAFGTFGQPNPFGGFMGLVAPVAVALTLGYALRTWNQYRLTHQFDFTTFAVTGFYGVASVLIALGVIISWSRGAWLAFAAALLIVAVSIPRKLWQSLAILIVLLLAGVIIWNSGYVPQSIADRINSATEEIFAFNDVRAVDITTNNYAVVERLAHWQAAFNMADANPALGVGFGNYEIVYDEYRLINWDESLGHAHNYYLNVLAETGIIGFLAYLVLWGGVFWMTWRSRSHPDPVARFLCIGLLGTWTYLSVHSLTDQLYVNNLFLHIGVMLSLVAVIYDRTWINIIKSSQ